jgi:hypothetical protein
VYGPSISKQNLICDFELLPNRLKKFGQLFQIATKVRSMTARKPKQQITRVEVYLVNLVPTFAQGVGQARKKWR